MKLAYWSGLRTGDLRMLHIAQTGKLASGFWPGAVGTPLAPVPGGGLGGSAKDIEQGPLHCPAELGPLSRRAHGAAHPSSWRCRAELIAPPCRARAAAPLARTPQRCPAEVTLTTCTTLTTTLTLTLVCGAARAAASPWHVGFWNGIKSQGSWARPPKTKFR